MKLGQDRLAKDRKRTCCFDPLVCFQLDSRDASPSSSSTSMPSEVKSSEVVLLFQLKDNVGATDRYQIKKTLYYWAIQRSWFARVNVLCNLSRKQSREVAEHFRADF